MRRRDFTIGLLLAVATQSGRVQGPSKQHRIAIVITTGPVSRIDDPGSHFWHPFWEELRRLGDIEGQNLAVERYAGEGRPEGYADLFREVVNRNPDVIKSALLTPFLVRKMGSRARSAADKPTPIAAVTANGQPTLRLVGGNRSSCPLCRH